MGDLDLLFYFRFNLLLLNGRYEATSDLEPSGWTHIVMNYMGPNDNEGTRVYYNGQELMIDVRSDDSGFSAGDGRIVIGRLLTSLDDFYRSIMVDELIFFNRPLSTSEIEMIYNAV